MTPSASTGDPNRRTRPVDGPAAEPVDRIVRAAAILRRGGVVAFPTETVYGLGADATDEEAVTRLFDLKGRPAGHPVIAHVGDPSDLDRWGDLERSDEAASGAARRLVDGLWPGPCTVIVARRAGGIVDAVTGGRPSVGLRMPDHPMALELLDATDRPLAAPSANRFGRVSPTRAADVHADLGGEVDLVLDGGPCDVGLESTIVDCSGGPPMIRRLGGVPSDVVEAIVGHEVPVVAELGVASGTLPTHYAPRARVEIVSEDAIAARARGLAATGRRVGVLGTGLDVAELCASSAVEDLTVEGDVEAFARALYVRLRRGDALGVDVVLAVPPKPVGLGAAIADRLRRAAGRA